MGYRINSIDLFVRDICPPRIDFAIGKGKSLFPEWMRVNVEVCLKLESDDGRTAFGCSADWPSFGWLDKRPTVKPRQKLRELLELVIGSRDAFLSNSRVETVFDCWWKTQAEFHETFNQAVPLCSSFAIALIERALVDACCRLEGLSFQDILRQDRLGFRPERIHPELQDFHFVDCLPQTPLDRIHIRHTVGLNDPLTSDDVNEENRLDDGLPHTLEDYVARDGITYFKIKICGDGQNDWNRLQQIWEIIGHTNPVITLDGNEACDDANEFSSFVETLAREQPELFDRILFIEQPMNRGRTHDVNLKPTIESVSRLIPLVIDEADGYLHAFAEATEIGYQGVSHKNCKGLFKSLANYALCKFRNRKFNQALFLSAEDLTSLPVVALHQDFVVISTLGLPHAERNGHHFFFGLNHLTDTEKIAVKQHHPDLYEGRNGDLFLKIENGQVTISSLQVPGMGVTNAPDWNSMSSLERWLADFDSASSSQEGKA